MVSLTTIALGVSVITTSILTFHDTIKQAQYAQGFVSYLLNQNFEQGAQYAIDCVTSTLGERINTRGPVLKETISNISLGFVNENINNFQSQVSKTLEDAKIKFFLKEVEEKENKELEEPKRNAKRNFSFKNTSIPQTDSIKIEERKSFWESFTMLKESIKDELNKEIKEYYSFSRQRQKEAILKLYKNYKENSNIYNDKWMSPFNFLMLAVFGIASFFFPKLTILLNISYFISCEFYLLSDTICRAIDSEALKKLKFDRIIEFHLAIIGAMFGYEKYQQNRGSIRNENYKRFSMSF